MPVYKDKGKGNYYVSFHYEDWTGKNVRKLKRGFATKKEATEWERHFKEELAVTISRGGVDRRESPLAVF